MFPEKLLGFADFCLIAGVANNKPGVFYMDLLNT